LRSKPAQGTAHFGQDSAEGPYEDLQWFLNDAGTLLEQGVTGMIRAPEGPGLGLKLLPDVPKRQDAHLRRSAL
tara:strand:- start:149 stop:367 length:219 start_codon:yes stop_codon:yes gene_type:complete